jgi:anaerobic magnesium-protoporphyrin IX monomethyl ester cyclase
MRVLLIAYDNESYNSLFPTNLGYIAAVLKQNSIDVDIYCQDIHHWPETHLTEYLDKNRYDVVGLGVIGGYYQFWKMKKISYAIHKSKNRPLYVLGGHGPTPEPEYFLTISGADCIIMGEGEDTIVELLSNVADGSPLDGVKGIAYRDNDQIIVNERRPLIKDIDSIPFPAYDEFPVHQYRKFRAANSSATDFSLQMMSGRGCPFKCNFCYRMDKGLRIRSNESIIEEISFLKKEYGITYIIFADELMMTSISRINNLCEDFIKKKIAVKWCCNGRLNYAKKDALRLMKTAGCVFINYGIESFDDEILKNMNKVLTTEIIEKGIRSTLDAGISPGYNIIWGNIGENLDTLRKSVDFLLKYDDCAQLRTIRPVTPYPGSPLYYYAIKEGLIDKEQPAKDFYENKHLNSDLLAVNFTSLSDDEFHNTLYFENSRLIRNYHEKQISLWDEQCRKLYFDKDVSFRGFR